MLKTIVTKNPVLNSMIITEFLIGILMLVHLYRSRSLQEYAVVDRESLNLTCSINSLGHLSEGVVPSNEELDYVEEYSLDQTHISLVKRVNEFIEQYVENIRKIATRFNFEVEGEGIACCRNFKDMINSQCLDHYEIVDLSGLEIDLLPCYIGLFRNIKQLNLFKNQLRVLPVDLLKLENLEVIDLTENPIVELPDWITENPRLTILMDTTDTEEDDWAQEPMGG